MKRGHINIWRKLMDTAIYKDSEALHLWVHLLMMAKLEPTTVIFKHKTFKLKRSQLVTTTTQLGKETGIDRTKIQRLGLLLEKLKMIKRDPQNACTVVTILKYDKYQPDYDPEVVVVDENQILTKEQLNNIMISWKKAVPEQWSGHNKWYMKVLTDRRKEIEGMSIKAAKSWLMQFDVYLNDEFNCERVLQEDIELRKVMAL